MNILPPRNLGHLACLTLFAASLTLRSAEVPAGDQAPTWERLTAASVRALKASQPETAERLCRQAMDLTRDAGAGDTRLARTYALLGEIQRSQKQPDLAEQSFKEAVAVCERSVGTNHPGLISPLESLANFYTFTQVRPDQVAVLSERILNLVEQSPEPDPAEVAIRARNLADTYVQLGRHAQAEPFYRKALASAEKADSDVPGQLLTVAEFYRAWKKYDQAEPLARRALALREKTLADNPSPDTTLDVANALDALARICLDAGKPEPAESMCRRSLSLRESVAGPESADLAAPMVDLAASLQSQGKRDQAEAQYRRALQLVENDLGGESAEAAGVLEKYAACLKEMEKPEQAAKLLERAAAIKKKLTEG